MNDISALTRAGVIIGLILVAILLPPHAEGADGLHDVILWSSLVDPAAQEFEDPFHALDSEALSKLRTYTSLTERLQAGEVDANTRPQLVADLEEVRLALTARDIDPDWLLSQRWEIAKRRQAAAYTGNPDLDGKAVILSGYYIPAFQAVDGSSVGYLVSQRGMCAHLPAPPPNQLVRLVLPANIDAAGLYDHAEIQGRLTLANTTQTVFVVDGDTRMRSAWTLHVDDMQSEVAGPEELSPWSQHLPWASRPVGQGHQPTSQAADSADD